jgi:hypothetical protein
MQQTTGEAHHLGHSRMSGRAYTEIVLPRLSSGGLGWALAPVTRLDD